MMTLNMIIADSSLVAVAEALLTCRYNQDHVVSIKA